VDDDDLRDMFAGLGTIQIKRMFGGKGIYYKGLITALVVQGEVLLKADAISAPEFEAAGARQWTYESRKGKSAAMPYWSIPDNAIDDPDELAIWVRKAYEASIRATR
jgi:DNA transformation protein